MTNSELSVDRGAAPGIDYEALVEKGAGLIHDGHTTVEELTIPSRVTEEYSDPGFTADDLREDVQQFLEEHAPEYDPEDDDEEDDVDERPVTDGVDWQSLWEEFGFDTRGPDGTYYANPLQLKLGLEVSDYARGNPKDLINGAVDAGVLVEVTAEGTHGETCIRGYGLQHGGGA